MGASPRFDLRCCPAACRGGRLLVAGWLLAFGTGCARRTPAPALVANVPETAAVRLLGNVRVIGTGGRFVLIETSVTAVATGLRDGQVLVCRAAGADSATLRVSHERRPPFVVADVTSGEPHVGDEVFVEPTLPPTVKPIPPATSPRPKPALVPPPAPPAS